MNIYKYSNVLSQNVENFKPIWNGKRQNFLKPYVFSYIKLMEVHFLNEKVCNPFIIENVWEPFQHSC
jgi:hypothetical protein